MSARRGVQDDAIGRNQARRHRLRGHLIRTAEARQRQAEAIARAVHRVWTSARGAMERLLNGKSRAQTAAANGEQISGTGERASVVDAFRQARLRPARWVRRFILEPYARRRRRRIAIAQLRSLDDHLLADIGVMRGHIELAVDGILPRQDRRFSRPVGRGAPAAAARDELPMAA